MEHGKEKRRDARVPLILRVDYPGLPAAVRDATENLSASGLFIRTERDLQVGQRVPLVVSFPGLLDPVEVEVEVVRVRTSAAEGPPGVAVRVLDPGHQARLASLVDNSRAPGPAKRDFTVLVVEDNVHVLEMYEYALKKLREKGGARVNVEFAHDGHEALQRLASSPKPDLIMTDLYMPVMDGFTLVEQMRADAALADLPVMVISAGGPDARARAIEVGVDVYLQKPVQFADIMSTVRALLHVG
ncbi:MAG: response regulator [Anaeromyxobacter sp.]